MGAVGDTTTTDPRSRRNRVSRRGGQLLTRALGSSNSSACPHFVLPVPLSRMVAPYARTVRSRPDRSAPPTLIPVTNILERYRDGAGTARRAALATGEWSRRLGST